MKNRLTIIALLAALCVSLYFVNANSHAAPAAQTWEYKFEYNMNEKKVNQLGTEGWELVAIGGPGSGPTSNVETFAFKRAK